MTELEIASIIQNYVTSNEGVTNSALDLEQIRKEVDSLRIRFVQELESKRTIIAEAYYQTLTTNDDHKPRIITSGPWKGWTELEIPNIHINNKGIPQISYAGPEHEMEPNKVVSGNQHVYYKNSRFSNLQPLAHISNGKIRFKENYKKVSIKALFECPSDLESYDVYDHESDNYPMPSGQIDQIIGKTAESYIRTQSLKIIQPNNQVDNLRTQ